MAKLIGIYKIVNLTTGQVYVGQSVDLNSRISHHKTALKYNKHCNQLLQNSWNKYGSVNFNFSIYQTCLKDELDELEIKYINEEPLSFNLTSGGNLYKSIADSTKLLLRDINLGKKTSEETKKRISESSKGRIKSISECNNISKALTGVLFTDQRRENISKATKGRISHNRKKVIDTDTGVVFSSLKEASDNCGIKYSTLAKYISKGTTSMRYLNETPV